MPSFNFVSTANVFYQRRGICFVRSEPLYRDNVYVCVCV